MDLQLADTEDGYAQKIVDSGRESFGVMDSKSREIGAYWAIYATIMVEHTDRFAGRHSGKVFAAGPGTYYEAIMGQLRDDMRFLAASHKYFRTLDEARAHCEAYVARKRDQAKR
jgi:hypothetical protein